ncbi:related to SGT1 protein [Ustilago trichophora]|uniref:Related to SGT1 protein n=1 Tax=Ustilago trichophora TaxID=86804 RepID=A0A5C3DRG5_9BASI|nr:related to SGT1 protein [Ustilago trichophora]
MNDHSQPPDGALPFSDVTGLLSAAASAEKQQALVARIFLPRPSDPTTSASIDQFAHLSSIAKELKHLFRKHTRSSDDLDGRDYIWHREPPSISVICPPSPARASTSKSLTQHAPHILFHLRTGGECIEDEWYATHLLIRASTQLAEHQLCISVEDEDGQFLLIEAADHLPYWVTPEAVTNRVWIFDGHLHLIPPHHKSNDDDSISSSNAVELVTDKSTVTRASDDIEAAAFARAYEFPSAAGPHHHRTLAYLPHRVARVLAADPQLIANCVTSVQSRDIVSSRSGSRLVHFPPPPHNPTASTAGDASATTNDNDIVLTPVRLTRHLYAQLLYDRFFPPRQLGPRWQTAVEKYRARLYRQPSASANRPKIENEAEIQVEMQQGRWHDLGAKIWCGLEMAYTESLARRTRTKARPMAATEPAISATERERLISSLTKLGFFQGEIEGSTKWKQLEAEALSQYAKGSTRALDDNMERGEEALLCDSVDTILHNQDQPSSTLLTVLPSDAAMETLKAAEDDDSWLQLNPDDIDSILQTKTSSASTSGNPVSEQDTFHRLGAFNSKMEDFIKTKSGVDGALFEDELNADDMLLDDEDLLFEDMDEDEMEERVRTEVQERMRTGGEEGKKKIVERLIPRMSQDEWTRKPNSQTLPWQSSVQREDFVSSIDRIAAERALPGTTNTTSVTTTTYGPSKDLTRQDNVSRAHAELKRRLASQYMRETSQLLSSQTQHRRYDGASDSDSEELEEETSPEVRKARAAEYDIEPDVESSTAPPFGQEEWEDMGEQELIKDEEKELGDLLEYARISLGLTKEQYEEILEERQKKGKFVPTPTLRSKQKAEEPVKLDTFESVMAAMESQLQHLQSTQRHPLSSSSTSPASKKDTKTTATSSHSEETPTAEDKELLSHLLKSNSDLPASLFSHLGGKEEEIAAEQMEGFLRSFQAQTGTSGPGSGTGPVELLMRRFGLGGLPADQDSNSQH